MSPAHRKPIKIKLHSHSLKYSFKIGQACMKQIPLNLECYYGLPMGIST